MRNRPESDTSFQAAALPGVLMHAIAASGAVRGITITGGADDFPLLYANESFQRLTGYPPEEILGRNCRFLQGPGTDPDEVRRLGEALRQHRDAGVVLLNYRRDGTPFWNKVSVSPVRDSDTGRVTHIVGTQIDVTDLVGGDRVYVSAGR